MQKHNYKNKNTRRGAALIIAMIFMAVLSSLGYAMLSMSSANVQMADNQHQGNLALTNAQSGLEVMRYWFNNLTVSGNDLSSVATALNVRLASAGVTNISVSLDDPLNPTTLTIASVTLNSQTNQSFSAVISQIDADTLRLSVTGANGNLYKQVNTNLSFGSEPSGIFDYGVATNGPLYMTGNARIEGVNSADEADIYIESPYDNEALDMTGNSEIAGDVSIANENGYVDFRGNAQIGGQSGQDAIDNHVTIGESSVAFPTPNPTQFEVYAANIVDSSVSTNGNITFENIRVVSGTNPNFNGNITINGIVYIETGNHVTFTGNTTITGMVVAEGDLTAPSSQDQVEFSGNLICQDVSQLPQGSQFDGLRDMTGTFILAPGFDLSFSGNFSTINGAIAASGVSFSGNAGGTITNSVINYSDNPMTIIGNGDISIDRSSSVSNPSGFGENIVLEFGYEAYSEGSL
jgi:Tfp pilus assembly protein PilX